MKTTRSTMKQTAVRGPKKRRKKTVKAKFDIGGYLKKLDEVDVGVDCPESKTKALKSLDITKKHYSKANRIINRFVQGLGTVCKLNNRCLLYFCLLLKISGHFFCF